MDTEELRNRFLYHPPIDASMGALHEVVRNKVGRLALDLNSALPAGREKALVMTHLEEAMMWANAAIARNQDKFNAEMGDFPQEAL